MKTTLTTLIIAAIVAAMLAGCGSSNPSSDNTKVPDPKTIPGSAASGGSHSAPAAAPTSDPRRM